MKKEYESPKAEKLEFDYSEAVVASGCINGRYVSHQGGSGTECSSQITDPSQTNEI